MLSERGNPLLAAMTEMRSVDMAELAGNLVHDRARRKREPMLLWRKQNAETAIEGLTADNELYGFTKGQFSLLDLLKACLKRTGPASVDFSTWTAARAEILELVAMRGRGEITEIRWLVDMTFVRRDPQAAAAIREAFGLESIRVAQCHAKFAVFRNAEWTLCLRSSMNLNMNPRTEDFFLANDPEMAAFLGGIMDQIWAKQKRSLADERPGVIGGFFREL